MKSNYDILGNHIRLIDTRNKDNITDRVLGINIDKYFMPSVANVIGTDLSKYKLITKGKFACNPMHVGRDERLPVALYNEEEPAIVSPAYFMFEVIDNTLLNEEYLMMWLRRPEFDRVCWFHTDGSVRGGITWDDICRLEVPVPPTEEQLEIVSSYKAITDRIALKQKINDNLFDQAKTILRHLYDKEIHVGSLVSLNDFCTDAVSGGTPSRTIHEFWSSNDVPWLKNGEIKNNVILSTEEYISKEGLAGSSAKLVPQFTVNMAMYCVSDIQVSLSCIPLSTNQAVLNLITDSYRKACFVYYFLASFGNELTSQANGSAQQNLSKEKIVSYEFREPELDNNCFDFLEFNMNERIRIAKEIVSLKEMQVALLSRLSY